MQFVRLSSFVGAIWCVMRNWYSYVHTSQIQPLVAQSPRAVLKAAEVRAWFS